MKRALQRVIRGLHVRLLDRGLPGRVGIYGHDTPEETWDGIRAMVAHFRGLGYRFVGPGDFVTAGEPCAFLSFDDNYHSWYRALGLLDELDVRATFYVNTIAFGDRSSQAIIDAYFDRIACRTGRQPLTTVQLQEIASRGHTIGCHTHSHSVLSRLRVQEAREEIRRSKDELEAILGSPIRHFAYPFGMRRHFTDELRGYCTQLGLTVANATLGLQHADQRLDSIQRSRWDFARSITYNVENLCVDGRAFVRLTGRSPVI